MTDIQKKEGTASLLKKADVVLVLALGIFLLITAARQAAYALTIAPSTQTLDAILDREIVPPSDVDSLIKRETSALNILDTAVGWADLGMAQGLRASYASGTEEAATLKEAAHQSLIRSLVRAPANPYIWLRLAVLRLDQGAPDSEILTYWRQSHLTGPNENRLYLARIGTGLGLWNDMTTADRQALFHDIQYDWPQNQNELVGMAAKPFSRAVIRSALLADLTKLRAFEEIYALRGVK